MRCILGLLDLGDFFLLEFQHTILRTGPMYDHEVYLGTTRRWVGLCLLGGVSTCHFQGSGPLYEVYLGTIRPWVGLPEFFLWECVTCDRSHPITRDL